MRLVWLSVAIVLLAGCQTSASNSGVSNTEAANYNVQAGLGYLQSQNYQRALVKFDKAIAQGDDSIQAQLGRAAALNGLSRDAEAQQAFVNTLSQYQNSPSAYLAYSRFLCSQGQLPEAEKVSIQGLKKRVFANQALPYLRLADCALDRQQFRQAELYIRRAEELRPGLAATQFYQARLAYQTNDFATARSALSVFEKSSPLRPESALLGYQLANAMADSKRSELYANVLRQNYPSVWAQLSDTATTKD